MEPQQLVDLIANNGFMVVLSSIVLYFLYNLFNGILKSQNKANERFIETIDIMLKNQNEITNEAKRTQENVNELKDIVKEVEKKTQLITIYQDNGRALAEKAEKEIEKNTHKVDNYRETLNILIIQLQQNSDENKEIKDMLIEHEKNTMLIRELIKDLINKLKED